MVALAADAHGGQNRLHRPEPARRVGEQAQPLAGGPQTVETIERTGIGLLAIVEHAPEIQDEAVVAVGQGRDAAQNRGKAG